MNRQTTPDGCTIRHITLQPPPLPSHHHHPFIINVIIIIVIIIVFILNWAPVIERMLWMMLMLMLFIVYRLRCSHPLPIQSTIHTLSSESFSLVSSSTSIRRSLLVCNYDLSSTSSSCVFVLSLLFHSGKVAPIVFTKRTQKQEVKYFRIYESRTWYNIRVHWFIILDSMRAWEEWRWWTTSIQMKNNSNVFGSTSSFIGCMTACDIHFISRNSGSPFSYILYLSARNLFVIIPMYSLFQTFYCYACGIK